MTVVPDRLYMDENDRELYDRLDTTGVFKSSTRKEQFLFALGMAFMRGIKRPIKKREGLFLAKDMRPQDEALLNAVAVHHTDSVDVLADTAMVFKIAEQYAHAGIRLLVNEMESTQHGTFEKRLEKQLYEAGRELGLVND